MINKLLQWAIAYIKNFLKEVKTKEYIEPTVPKLDPIILKPIMEKPESMQDMCARVCREENLNSQLTYELLKTINCESGYNPQAKNQNKNAQGKVTSTDWGIIQVNDYWHIGAKKDFPSVEYVLANPEACVRWMCKMFKAGKANLWVCHNKLFPHA